MQFQEQTLDYMKCVLWEVQNSEQTQELKLPDGMPDVGSVIQAWGQPIMRSKEWRSDTVSFSGGMMVWVLYRAEGQKEPQILSTWVPFQMRWDIPERLPDGDIRVSCLTRYTDARSISPRKIMLRCGMGALCEAYVPDRLAVYSASEADPAVQLLQNTYTLKLSKLAGEKAFQLEEAFSVPESVPAPGKLIYCALDSRLRDSRVLTDKLVFRGQCLLHICYLSEDGQVHSWDFEMPFSQLAELGRGFGQEAAADLRFQVTNLETEPDQNRGFRVKCALVAQYVIRDQESVTLAEDAYSVNGELKLQQEAVTVPVILEQRQDPVQIEGSMQVEADIAADVRLLPEHPVSESMEDQHHIRLNGCFQLLYYGSDGVLTGANVRWEAKKQLPAGENVSMRLYPQPGQPHAAVGSGSVSLKSEVHITQTAWAEQTFQLISGIQLGQKLTADPEKPSVVILRSGERSLWELAKDCGSTVEAIRVANGLTEEAVPGKMLLIPIL